jgi:hypothetical protein
VSGLSQGLHFVVSDGASNDALFAQLQGLGFNARLVSPSLGLGGIGELLDSDYGDQYFDRIAFYSHATSGSLSFGETKLNNQTIASYHDALASIGKRLSPEGDLLLYGCNLASDLDGQNLIANIAQLSGRDVAASIDITGRDGNWDLEYRYGEIDTQGFDALTGAQWHGNLGLGDIAISITSNRLVLALDPLGVDITNLYSSYNNVDNVISLTAETPGDISASSALPGLTIEQDTIRLDLDYYPRFAGIHVLGGAGTDSIAIGPQGINLAATLRRGASAQGLIIDTGLGEQDLITLANSIQAKGSGAVTFKTAGDIRLSADTTVSTGGNLRFDGLVDGPHSLSVAGADIRFAQAVGSDDPLKGLALARARSATFANHLHLDGSGLPDGSIGLSVAANVSRINLAQGDSFIQHFSGSGIRFSGGSTNSRFSNVTITGNGVGISLSAGNYAGTSFTSSLIEGNTSDGIRLSGARGVAIGSSRRDSGNQILFNGGYGISASGSSASSSISGQNLIANNRLGVIEGLTLLSAPPPTRPTP